MYWFVARSKMRQEFKAKEYFEKMGIPAYVPHVRVSNSANRNLKRKPAISGYVFFSLPKFNYGLVNRNPLIGDVVKNYQGVIQVPEKEIMAMKKHLSSNYENDDFQEAQVGDTIELSHGVFSGRTGEIVVKDKKRLIINLKSIAMRLTIALN